MKALRRKIIVVGTLIQRKAYYVKTLDRRSDGRFTVTLSTDIKEANEFESRQDANRKKDKINNPFERQYEVEEKVVDWLPVDVSSVPGDLK